MEHAHLLLPEDTLHVNRVARPVDAAVGEDETEAVLLEHVEVADDVDLVAPAAGRDVAEIGPERGADQDARRLVALLAGAELVVAGENSEPLRVGRRLRVRR